MSNQAHQGATATDAAWQPRAKGDMFAIQLHIEEAGGMIWHLYQLVDRNSRNREIADLMSGKGDALVKRALDTHGSVELVRVHGPLPMSKRRCRGYIRWMERECAVCDRLRSHAPASSPYRIAD